MRRNGEGKRDVRIKNRIWQTTGVAALALAAAASLLGAAPSKAQPAAGVAVDACGQLAGVAIARTEIVSANAQAAALPVAGARLPGMSGNAGEGPAVSGLPAFCRVVGRIHPEPGSDIRFEVWLPASGGDGRLNGIGIGGFAGSIDYLTLGLAVKAGQASVATDTGHQGSSFDSSWARGHPERVRDYGWRAVHLSTLAAKALVAAYYQRAPAHSYFIGCSGGGRQGLMEAARFPEDYDGIVAGAPAASMTDLVPAMVNPVQAQLAPGAAIRPEQAELIQSEVLKQCAASDGLVADPRQCHFDVAKLACGTSSSPQCFTPAQMAALRRIYAGPRNASGRQVAAAYLPSGSEPGNPAPALGWDGYILAKPGAHSQAYPLAQGALQDFIAHPFATAESFDFDRDTPRLKAALSGDLDAPPDLRRFFQRGGKLIVWHGWADAAIPPGATLRWRAAMLRASGPLATHSSRLFMVPGVQHCMGGAGADSFGQLNAPKPGDTPDRGMAAALQAWVENNRPPDALVGRRGLGGLMGIPSAGPERQRLLCAWPRNAALTKGAGPDSAASYTCVTPKRSGEHQQERKS